ncbi:MAG: metallophosphoesterase family protein [Rhodomicrobium sp.]
MKLAVLTDVHANLPALKAALSAIEQEGYDLLVHLGDAIATGPFPAETLELLLSVRKARFIMGNHDAMFASGLPTPAPAWMSKGQAEHQRWTHAQMSQELRSPLAGWPYRWHCEFEGVSASFSHYALDASGEKMAKLMPNPAPSDLDNAFPVSGPTAPTLTFHGHNHSVSDIQGRSRYLDPGSLGCAPRPVARYFMAEFRRGGYRLEHRVVPYEDDALRAAFEKRRVPQRAHINRTFFGGRFPDAGS